LTYTLINTGPAPALNVQVDPRIAPLVMMGTGKDALVVDPSTGGFRLVLPSDAMKTLRSECAAFAKLRRSVIHFNYEFGEAIFPKQESTSAVILSLSKAEIESAMGRSLYRTITPQVRFCVTYGFSVDNPLHETGRVYDILRVDPSAAGGMTQIDPALGNVPRDMLRLHPNFLGSSYAN
jgi:hypothetical protein